MFFDFSNTFFVSSQFIVYKNILHVKVISKMLKGLFLNNIIYTTRLFLWFLGDFGGKRGVRKLLNKSLPVKQNNTYKLSFNSYNWDELLNNFA